MPVSEHERLREAAQALLTDLSTVAADPEEFASLCEHVKALRAALGDNTEEVPRAKDSSAEAPPGMYWDGEQYRRLGNTPCNTEEAPGGCSCGRVYGHDGDCALVRDNTEEAQAPEEVCEDCGAPAATTWLVRLCAEHAAEFKAWRDKKHSTEEA